MTDEQFEQRLIRLEGEFGSLMKVVLERSGVDHETFALSMASVDERLEGSSGDGMAILNLMGRFIRLEERVRSLEAKQ